jgi:hypothetical protein
VVVVGFGVVATFIVVAFRATVDYLVSTVRVGLI